MKDMKNKKKLKNI